VHHFVLQYAQQDQIRSASGRDLNHLDPEVRSKYNSSGPIEDFYKVGRLLGKGGFATVRHGALVPGGA
jgi:hypothetical protein